jgi:hypothetical protein
LVLLLLLLPPLQVRLHFLGKLLPEAHAHLAATLTASVLGVKLLTLPFHRKIGLTQQDVRAMRAALHFCQQVRLTNEMVQSCDDNSTL